MWGPHVPSITFPRHEFGRRTPGRGDRVVVKTRDGEVMAKQLVRRTARSSIRKRKRTSEPGKPPSSHTGLLKKFIFFGYDPRRDSVVIGPVRLTQKGRGEAPSLLEYGGNTSVEHRGQRKRARVRARPFMGPAFEQEQPKLPAIRRDRS